MGKLAVKTGLWVLYEREHGQLRINPVSKAAMKRPAPLDDYLGAQGRFRGISAEARTVLHASMERNHRRLLAEEAGQC